MADFSDLAVMGNVARLILSLALAVAVLATAMSQPASALTSEIAAASMPCCDDDCPEDPACNMACRAMIRCASGIMGIALSMLMIGMQLRLGSAATVPDPPWRVGDRQPEGLKRPPRI